MKSGPLPVKTCLPALTLALGLALAPAGPAHASRLNGDIEEVVAGAYGRPEIQYVELVGDLCGTSWAGEARLGFYDPADQKVGEFVFPAEPPQGCSALTSVLVGTQAFADLPTAPDPDFLMPPLLVPGSGKVCFEVPADATVECLTYGAFAGVTHQESPFNAPALPAAGTCALRIANPAAFNTFEPFNADYDLLPPEPRNGAGQTGGLDVPPRFADVSAASPFQPFVEAMFNAGVTGGCGSGSFCPSAPVTRDQMAVFLLRAKEGAAFQPPPCTVPRFADVPCSSPFAPWINELGARGITGGCGGGNYCPGAAVDRAQMALFLLLTAEGQGYQPPACTSPVFADVPCSDPFAPWINELAARGITGGCGGAGMAGMGNYCPGGLVTREQMAVFLSTTFELPVPSRSCLLPPEVDDHGDVPEEATPVVPLTAAPGLLVSGTFERPRDTDVLSLTAQQGDQFTLVLAVQPGDGPEVELQVETVAGFLAGFSSSTSEAAVGGFTALHSGTFFISLRDQSGRRIGGYQLFLRGPVPDDHADTTAGATPISMNGPSAGGEIEFPTDVDVFSFPATAGEVYIVETVGDDPEMAANLAIFRADGTPVASAPSTGPQTQAAFQATVTGTYFARVLHGQARIGTYEIRVRGPIPDDHGNTPGTATPLAPGAPAAGELVSGNDRDLFAFTAAAGDAFLVTVEYSPPNVLHSPHLRVIDAGGTGLAFGSPVVSGRVVALFLAPQAGTFFVEVGGTGSAVPVSYTVELEGPLPDDHGDFPETATPLTPGTLASPVIPGHNEIAADVDFFSFPATAGQTFLVDLQADPDSTFFVRVFDAGGTERVSGDGRRLVFTAPQTGTSFVSVERGFSETGLYGIRVRGPIVDDHGGRPSQSTPLAPNTPPLLAELELAGDVDLFSFDALAGETFVAKAESPEGGIFTEGVRLELLDTNGLTVLVSSQGGSFGIAAQALLQAPRTGRYFLRISGTPQPYRVSLSGPFPDDHGNTAATATLLTLDGPFEPGVIEWVGDADTFAFDAVAGETVTVETGGLGQGLDTLLEVAGPDGTVLADDDDGAGDFASRITFTVPATGRYMARVTSFPGTTGTYHISARR